MNKKVTNLLYQAAQGEKLSQDQRQILLDNGYPLHALTGGTHLIHQDEPLEEVLFLISGNVMITQFNRSGKRNIASYLEAPQFFGLIEYLTGRREPISGVMSVSEVEYLRLSSQSMEYLLKSPVFYPYFLKYLAQLNQQTMTHAMMERFLDDKILLMDHLFHLAENQSLPAKITEKKQDLSDLLHIGLRSLYRYLSELESEGYLTRKGQSLIIDKDQFLKLSDVLSHQ